MTAVIMFETSVATFLFSIFMFSQDLFVSKMKL